MKDNDIKKKRKNVLDNQENRPPNFPPGFALPPGFAGFGSLREALGWARGQLKANGVAGPALDAEVLLAHVTGLDRAGLHRERERPLEADQAAAFAELIGRRCAGEPVAYLAGHKEFMGLDFLVGPDVLIPRPETELLVETALKLLPAAAVIIEAGTGSGAVAVSLARLAPNALVHATDCSPGALAVARENAARHGVAERVFFYCGDLLEPLAGLRPPLRADLVAANLPYIDRRALAGLPREVACYEPRLALDGGAGGLELYRRLIPSVQKFLKQDGCLLLEIGSEQASLVCALLGPAFWETSVMQDLAGLDRLVAARLTSGPCRA